MKKMYVRVVAFLQMISDRGGLGLNPADDDVRNLAADMRARDREFGFHAPSQ